MMKGNGKRRVATLSSHLTSAQLHQSTATSSVVPVNKDSANGVEPDIPFVIDKLMSPTYTDLSEEQCRQYQNDGFFVVKNLLSEQEIDILTNRFLKICRGEVKTDALVMRDVVLAKKLKQEGQARTPASGEHEVTKVQNFENDAVLMTYARNEKILRYIAPIVGRSIRSTHTMLINKPPDLGQGTSVHPVHQDLLYFPFRPCNRVVAAWSALQKIDEENGCLYVVPGSHKLGMFPHFEPEGNALYQGIEQNIVDEIMKDPKYKIVQLPMEPGDTVFFHPCLFHGSGPNLSNRYRKAISCHYATGESVFPTLPDHNFQLIDEALAVGTNSRQYGKAFAGVFPKLSKSEKMSLYRIAWKNKSRKVAGDGIDDPAWELSEDEIAVITKAMESIQNQN